VIAVSNEFCNLIEVLRVSLLNKTWREFVHPLFHAGLYTLFNRLLLEAPLIDATKTFIKCSYLKKRGNIQKCYIRHTVTLEEGKLISHYGEIIGYYADTISIDDFFSSFSPFDTEIFFPSELSNPTYSMEEFLV